MLAYLVVFVSQCYIEILDYGYPQKTDSGILKTYITQQGIRAQVCPVMYTVLMLLPNTVHLFLTVLSYKDHKECIVVESLLYFMLSIPCVHCRALKNRSKLQARLLDRSAGEEKASNIERMNFFWMPLSQSTFLCHSKV